MVFDTMVAKDVGTDSAIILANIEYWQSKNRANKTNFHEGMYWTYNSVDAWCELFSYLSKHQIRHCLEKLIKRNYIVTGNFNKAAYDRTKWYCSIRQMDLGNIPNGIGKNPQPIPNINTDNNPNINTVTEIIISEKSVFSEEVNSCYNHCVKYFTEALIPKKEKVIESWKKTIEMLNRVDGVPFGEIARIVKEVREDSFWADNFQSMNKLRRKNRDQITYIVFFSQKFKKKEQLINKQSKEVVKKSLQNWGQDIKL